MPRVKKGETRSSYVKRAIPAMIKEGLTQKQAIGKAEGMYDSAKKGHKK